MPDSHLPLVERAFGANLSFVAVTARRGFSYEGTLLSLVTGRAAPFAVCSENTTLMLARPGANLMVLRAKVSFESQTKVWTSPYSIVALTVPERPSIVKLTMNTFPAGRK